MVQVHESHNEPNHVTIEHQEISIHVQIVNDCVAFVYKYVWVRVHVYTHSCHLDIFHYTQFRQGSAALFKNYLNYLVYKWGFGVLGFWGFGEIGRAHV